MQRIGVYRYIKDKFVIEYKHSAIVYFSLIDKMQLRKPETMMKTNCQLDMKKPSGTRTQKT